MQSQSRNIRAAHQHANHTYCRPVAATVLVCALMLTACGGSSGSSTTGAATPTVPSTPVAIEFTQGTKTRVASGFDVQVVSYAMSTLPTATTRLEIRVTDPSLITSLTAAIGKDFASAVPATVTPLANGGWNLIVPTTIASNSGLLLTFNLKDGDVYETGLSDFQFN